MSSSLLPHTMDGSQNEIVIENVEITGDLNYCYYAVLAFVIYDVGMSYYLLDLFICKLYPH